MFFKFTNGRTATAGVKQSRVAGQYEAQKGSGSSPQSSMYNAKYDRLSVDMLDDILPSDQTELQTTYSKIYAHDGIAGPAFRGETHRRGRALFESAGQSLGLVRRRKKSNPSPRPHATGAPVEEGAVWDDDARLQAQWYDHTICRAQHARWHGDRQLYAPPPPSRVYSIPPDDGRRNSTSTRPPSHRGQLRHPQTSPR